jgi:aldose 1-epimerase
MHVNLLENDHWQAGILPGTGASLAFGRVRRGSAWVDVFRPTPETDYGNSSACASFIMLPWCNRIKGGLLRFEGQEYPLRTTKDDGTARHGDVRGRAWQVETVERERIILTFRSTDFADVNWPFWFSARMEYRLEGPSFLWSLTIRNKDTRAMPAGFGHHPYFVRTPDVQTQVHCAQYFPLTDFMATSAPQPIPTELDYRAFRPLPASEVNDVLSGRTDAQEAARIRYPAHDLEIAMRADPVMEQVLLFAPAGKPFFAVEPMSNVSDGFNLAAQGIAGSGVFVLGAGEARSATVTFIV